MRDTLYGNMYESTTSSLFPSRLCASYRELLDKLLILSLVEGSSCLPSAEVSFVEIVGLRNGLCLMSLSARDKSRVAFPLQLLPFFTAPMPMGLSKSRNV